MFVVYVVLKFGCVDVSRWEKIPLTLFLFVHEKFEMKGILNSEGIIPILVIFVGVGLCNATMRDIESVV